MLEVLNGQTAVLDNAAVAVLLCLRHTEQCVPTTLVKAYARRPGRLAASPGRLLELQCLGIAGRVQRGEHINSHIEHPTLPVAGFPAITKQNQMELRHFFESKNYLTPDAPIKRCGLWLCRWGRQVPTVRWQVS